MTAPALPQYSWQNVSYTIMATVEGIGTLGQYKVELVGQKVLLFHSMIYTLRSLGDIIISRSV